MRMTRLFVSFLLLVVVTAAAQPEPGTPTNAVPAKLDPRTAQLIRSLGARNAAVRQKAMEQLVVIGAPAVPPLVEILEGTRPGDRRLVVQLLGDMGAPQAVDPLVAALKDEDAGVCKLAARSLGKLKDSRAVEPLMYAASYETGNTHTRLAAIEALGRIGDPHPVVFLMHLLKGDPEILVRDEAAVALDRIAGTDFRYDNGKRMAWIEEHHPEWLELDKKEFLHPGFRMVAWVVAGFAVFGVIVIVWAAKRLL